MDKAANTYQVISSLYTPFGHYEWKGLPFGLTNGIRRFCKDRISHILP